MVRADLLQFPESGPGLGWCSGEIPSSRRVAAVRITPHRTLADLATPAPAWSSARSHNSRYNVRVSR